MDVSIIIVSYNTKHLLLDCLVSIYKQTKDIDFEVIVSDNGSVDNSVNTVRKEFPQVIVLENNANLGFGAANNRGLSIAKGKYIFYLNSDTILLNNAVKEFYNFWENSVNKEKIGALGTMLLDKKGNFNTSYGQLPVPAKTLKYLRNCFLSSIYIKFLYSKFYDVNKVTEYYGEVGYVMGADLFVLNNSNAQFDERFFMFYEESDMQFYLQKLGKKSFIIKGPKIIHLGGGSSDDRNCLVYNFRKLTSIYFWESCLLYLNKNLGSYIIAKKLFLFLRLVYILPWNISKYNIAISRFKRALKGKKC